MTSIVFRSGMEAYSYGIENRTSVDMEVTFSVAKSKNVASSITTKEPIIKKIVPAHGFEFLMHVRKEDLSKPEYKFEYTYRHK